MLRELAAKGEAILEQSPLTDSQQTNWQQRVPKFEPLFNDARARLAGVTRDDVVRSIKQSLEGWTIGVFNQEDEALPIILRIKQDEVPGSDITALHGVQVRPANSAETVPLDQVIDGLADSLGRSDYLAPRSEANNYRAGQSDTRRDFAGIHGKRGTAV